MGKPLTVAAALATITQEAPRKRKSALRLGNMKYSVQSSSALLCAGSQLPKKLTTCRGLSLQFYMLLSEWFVMRAPR